MKMVFVILHYESIVDTKECLDSMLKYLKSDVQIIVVDNGSKVQKLNDIESDYLKYNIIFLYSNENLGFAKGNNLGYRYAKINCSADIIVLANNDLIFDQDDFVDRVIELYSQKKFDIAGPRIISLIDKKNQNPVPILFKTRRDIDIRIVKLCILYLLSIVGMDVFFQKLFAKKIQEFHPYKGEDYQLHGACLLLGGDYLLNHDGLYDETFMYNEESILKEIAAREKLNMLYLNELIVKHKEGSSTACVYGKGKKKRQFYYKWNIHSCMVLKKIKNEKI